ncbi:MAG: hypothetical protein M3083_14990 [Actinomycetota bacterium]|nr:hypothetical protein [Actinomycetota bacterium]
MTGHTGSPCGRFLPEEVVDALGKGLVGFGVVGVAAGSAVEQPSFPVKCVPGGAERGVAVMEAE